MRCGTASPQWEQYAAAYCAAEVDQLKQRAIAASRIAPNLAHPQIR